jgi:hypothetical protein
MLFKNWRDSGMIVAKLPELFWSIIDDRWTSTEMWSPVETWFTYKGYTQYSFQLKDRGAVKGMIVAHKPKGGKQG